MVRFLRADLEYGCHVRGGIEIPRTGSPIVVAGPNGAGKTTFLEALVRTLFGFNRQQPEERICIDSRVPWGREECRAEVVVENGAGRFRIERDFEEGRVRIEPLDGDGDPWSGDGNPASRNQEAREYRRRLAGIFGFSEIQHYLTTACIEQGQLVGTRLSEDLLRIAAGGHGNVDEAKAEIETAHRKFTLGRVAPEKYPGRTPQQLERVEREIEELERDLERARAAFRNRAPILSRRREIEQEMEALEAETGSLEAALGPLHERRTLQERKRRLEGQSERLDRLRRRLDEAARACRDAEEAAELAGEARYPDDFLLRLGRMEVLWDQRSALEGEREEVEQRLEEADDPSARGDLAIVALLLLAAFLFVVIDSALAALAVVVLALCAGAAFYLHRSRARREFAALESRQREIVAGIRRTDKTLSGLSETIPHGDTLFPETAEERKEEFEGQREVLEGFEEARKALQAALEETAEALEREDEGRTPEPTLQNLEGIQRLCDDRLRELATEIARQDLELEDTGRVSLPEGVEPEPDAVERALAERRGRIERLREEKSELDDRLREEGSAHENPLALQDRLGPLRQRRDELKARAAAHEAAFALVRDAYEEFRERDQERLLEAISDRLVGITRGHLGPIEAPGSLSEARVRARDRSVPLSSPPLSYGEWHAVLFAIRLGATDFLSLSGVRPPLIVDEPFAWLDLDRARELWELLSRIAEERQVLVATQEELTLEALGVEPDLEFERAGTR